MTANICPRCGNEVDAGRQQGLCPACLLQEGLAESRDDLSPKCVSCETVLDDDARFCGQCGTAVPAVAVSGDPLRRALDAKLHGQYRIIRLLGRGGMGAVYLARDLALERDVAIKVIRTGGEHRALYDRFRREAKTAARLSHPNIVPLHGFGEVEGMPYFVMGYVRGESLADRLRREGKLEEDDVRRIVAEIADALDHAHRQGVVHRDVKPDNVLLDDESGRALLTDFGVAKATGRGETLTSYGSVVGTPHFMSSEQAAGHTDIDGRSDIYSLGVMAYAMLAGRLPFDGATAAEVLTKQLTQAPAPLGSLAPDISSATIHVVERCMEKEREKRWPDARSLEQAIGMVQEHQLPDALQGVESQGVMFVLAAAAFLLIIRLLRAPGFAVLLNAGVLVTVYLVILFKLRREGFSVGQSQRAIWTEPSWWPFWYPRSLRRRGNVWDRLPWSIRRMRWWVPAFVAYFVILFTGTFPNLYRHPEAFILKIVVGGGVMLLSWVILEFRAKAELRRKGITGSDAERILMSMPASRASFWLRPHIVPLLAPVEDTKRPSRSDQPHDLLQAIIRNAGELSGTMRPLGAEAAAAGRQLVSAIEYSDRQIAELARNLDPGEEARLTERIAAYGTGEEYAAMRSLLEQQLELLRGLSARLERAREQRNRHVEMLKTLALHVSSLRAQSTETPSEVRAISENVRALCEDIGRQTLSGQDAPTVPSGVTSELPTVDRP